MKGTGGTRGPGRAAHWHTQQPRPTAAPGTQKTRSATQQHVVSYNPSVIMDA